MNFRYSQISPQDVREKLKSGDLLQVVDVRENWEHERRHIPQARLVPMGKFSERCRTGLGPSQEIIPSCEHGVWSEAVTQYLASLGYERVATMTGGMACYEGSTEGGV